MSFVFFGATLPSRKKALKGEAPDGRIIYFGHSEAKRDYRCPECKKMIRCREPNIVVMWPDRYYQDDNSVFRQHMHRGCAWQYISSRKIELEVCDDSWLRQLKDQSIRRSQRLGQLG